MSIIPALDRGLAVVEFLVLSRSPQRYVDIRKALGTISDASLNRLVSSLVGSGYVTKDAHGLYIPAPRMEAWGRVLGGKLQFSLVAALAVRAVVSEAHESAAFGLLGGERIQILASESCDNSVTIISPGQILPFATDHVGSLAILGALREADRPGYDQLLATSFRRMVDQQDAQRALAASTRDDYYFGESQSRVGVSRVAIPWWQDGQVGVLFMTMPSERLRGRDAFYAAILRNNLRRLQNKDS